MATAPQAAIEMPQQGANPFADPNTMAVYDQLRQTTSPKQFGDEMLAGASQADPQAVAEFLQELQGLNMPPEVLDALNDVVDEILASPDRYPELRKKYMEQGLPEEILPEQFDPQFFAALNMAIDQMIAAPSGVQSFAQGGIAELKPIAKAIASYGRNGDTMLAHITPAEARMLRRRGGSGTTNPDTGLPEFFLKNLFKGIGNALKSVGKAVKKFANSTVGRIITTVALGFFLGPAAAGLLGVSSAVGVAAVSGFIGSAGSTLLGGGNIGQALKAGAIGGLTAGAGAGLTGGSFASGSASTAGMTAGEAVSSQFNKFTGAFTPSAVATPPTIDTNLSATGAAPVPDPLGDFIQQNDAARTAANTPIGIKSVAGPVPSTDPLGDFIQQNDAARTAANTPARLPVQTAPAQPGAYKVPTVGESFSKIGEGLGMGEGEASFKTFKEGATDLFSPGPTDAQLLSKAQEIRIANPGTSLKDAMAIAKDMGPSMLRTYGPAAVAGLGTLAAFGGFNAKPAEPGDITRSLRKPVTQRIAEDGTQRQMYMQNLPGVVYDQYGAPVYGQSTRLPTYDVPDYNNAGYGLPQEQGRMFMPPVYTSAAGSIGSRRVEQPYNTSDMYSNLAPRQYADGGPVTGLYRTYLNRDPSSAEIDNWRGQFGDEIDERERAVFRESAAPEIAANAPLQQGARDAKAAEQKAARDAAAQQRAMRRSQGSGQMYSNINAGLAALAPETNPMVATDTGFGARNRAAGLGSLQTAYGPMLQNQRNAMSEQGAILARGPGMMPSSTSLQEPSGSVLTPAVAKSLMQRSMVGGIPTSEFVKYGGYDTVKALYDAGGGSYDKPTGIAVLAEGGYPRRTGQINGPGTEKSDSIPAMLSDGEFVMTAKAVRGAGKGSRRAGAKKMYALMHQLEKNSERG